MTGKEKRQSGELYDASDRELFYFLNGRQFRFKGPRAMISALDA